jgi:hypothetical protein
VLRRRGALRRCWRWDWTPSTSFWHRILWRGNRRRRAAPARYDAP